MSNSLAVILINFRINILSLTNDTLNNDILKMENNWAIWLNLLRFRHLSLYKQVIWHILCQKGWSE